MQNVQINLIRASKGVAPSDWSMDRYYYLQRIYYIKSGRGGIPLGSGEYIPFEPGKLYVLPCNMSLRFENDPDDRIDHIYFDFYSIPPIIADRPIIYDVPADSPLARHISLIDSLLYERHTELAFSPIANGRIADAPDRGRDSDRQLFFELLYTLLLLLSRIKPLPFAKDEIVIDTVDFIRSHYAEPITLDQLAERAGLNKIYFIRRFKKVMSVTPYAYLRSYRLMCAEKLLANGASYGEVAGKVGYLNAASLYNELHKR